MAQAHRRMNKGFRAAAWLFAAGAGASGCASAPPPPAGPAAPHPPPSARSETTYDWRPLMVVPFGTLLKDMPLALNEALQFRDAASDSGAEGRDCFSVDGASPPRVLDRRPQSYLLCFEHDRLHRIEAEVQLAPGEAGALLAALCAQWLAGAEDVERSAAGCTGREGGVELGVRLEDSSATLSMTLSDIRPVPRE
jgi:hypothetical protein